MNLTAVSLYINCLLFLLPLHDFHVSKTDLNYKTSQEALQITVHVFIDDLELALEDYGSSNMNLFTKSESLSADSLIAVYLNKSLEIKIDKEAIAPVYIGKEISDDLSAAWCYLEFENLSPFKSMSLKNSILNELFEDQKNIVNFKIDSKSKAFHIMDRDVDYKEFKL